MTRFIRDLHAFALALNSLDSIRLKEIMNMLDE